MKRITITIARLLKITVVILTLFLWLGTIYSTEAAPPEPEMASTSTPEPPIDIRTQLRPYQTPEVVPLQVDGRQLRKSSLADIQEAPIGTLAQQTFNAIADAVVLQGYPSLNFGDTSDMWAGYDDNLNPDGMIVRSLIKFNLASLPSNQDITKATLKVYLVSSWDFPNTYRTITTYGITSDWVESNITWNNSPSYGNAYGSKAIRSSDFTWHEMDVTNLVTGWYNGTLPNYGIMLRGPEFSGANSSWRGFSTREGTFIPQLVVDYIPSQTPPPDYFTYLPLVFKPAPQPPDGNWTGTTSRNQPMSFDVSSGGTAWSNFKLKTDFQIGPCSGTTEITLPGPGAITNNKFSLNSGSFSFSGQLNSAKTASGTYAYVNRVISGCGILNQSGIWTAQLP